MALLSSCPKSGAFSQPAMSLESPLARLVFQIGLKVTVSQIIKELALGLLGFLKDLISQVVRSAAKAQEPHSSP